MPVGIRRTISEMEEFEPDDEQDGNREGDVHFFLPTSRRTSEDEAATNARPRAYGMIQDSLSNFLLFHTFQLPSQSSPAQIAILPATATTGLRVLVACRDDTFRCFYFELDDSSGDFCITPKSLLLDFLPIERDWKVGALTCLPRNLHDIGHTDLAAYVTYRSPKEQTETDQPVSSWLTLSVVPEPDAEDAGKQKAKNLPNNADNVFGSASIILCGCKLPFLINGCNPPIWWKSPGVNPDNRVFLIISGQDEKLYSVTVNPKELSSELTVTNACDSIPEFRDLTYLTGVNAIEYIDIDGQNGVAMRVLAVSHKTRSEIIVGTINHGTGEWTQLWTAQHDSMTSRLRLFKNGQNIDLLVIGLCESAVIYRDVVSSSRPQPIVLPDSTRDDIVTCCDVADVDGDGQLEILLGTYGRAVLIYKVNEKEPSLLQRIETAFPVHYVALASMTCDTLPELLVITQKGVHVYCLFS